MEGIRRAPSCANCSTTHPKTRALIVGLADGSPYLWDLVRAEPERLVALLQSEPDARFDALLAEATPCIAAAATRRRSCGCCAG